MLDKLILSTAAYDGYGLDETLEAIAELGISNVEIAFIHGYTEPFTEDHFNKDNALMTVNLLQKYGLKCPSFSSHMDLSAPGIVQVLRKRMSFAKAIGADTIITNAAPVAKADIFYKNIKELAAYAEEIDLMIGLENPGDGVQNVLHQGSNGEEVITKIGSPNVGVNYDFGNLLSHCFEKVRPETDYLECAKQTVHYHLKDVIEDDNGWAFTPIGQGSIDYATILKEISQRDEYVPVSLEFPVRLRRDKNAQPIREENKIPMDKIQNVLNQSIDFIKEATN